MSWSPREREWCGYNGKAAFVRGAVEVLAADPFWLDELRPSDVVKVLVHVVPERDETMRSWCCRALDHWREEAQRAIGG